MSETQRHRVSETATASQRADGEQLVGHLAQLVHQASQQFCRQELMQPVRGAQLPEGRICGRCTAIDDLARDAILGGRLGALPLLSDSKRLGPKASV